MSDIQQRLQKLLDGELDPAEVAEDPALASLADRLYGIKIQPVQPKKLRDFDEQTNAPSAPLPATDMMIEVIGDVALEHPPAPAAELPVAPIAIASKANLEVVWFDELPFNCRIVVGHCQHVWASPHARWFDVHKCL